jgi:hypothetical protein
VTDTASQAPIPDAQVRLIHMGVRASEFLRSDNGYFTETNVNSCVAAAIKPYRAAGREAHHLPVEQRWTSPPPLAADANAVDEMKHRMTTPEGRAVDVQRKSTVDLCTGSSNPCRVFASFTLRGLKNVSGPMDTGQHRLESEAAFHLPSNKRDRRSAKAGNAAMIPENNVQPTRKCSCWKFQSELSSDFFSAKLSRNWTFSAFTSISVESSPTGC